VLILTGQDLKDSEYTLKFHRGDLFSDMRFESDSEALAAKPRAPISLDPSVDAVVELLRSAEN
jgi:threonine synthase